MVSISNHVPYGTSLSLRLHNPFLRYFLPLIERVRVSSGRKRRVLLPLFSSYVFFCGDEQDRLAAIKTNRLCRAIKVADQEKFLSELVNIERALLAKAKLDFYPFVAVGRRCRITAGYFEGVEGTVIHNNNTARIILEVSILGQGASMEVSADLLEPVD